MQINGQRRKHEMEKLGDMIASGTQSRQPKTSQDSTPRETSILADEAIRRGYKMDKPAPEPEHCKFCGKTLQYRGFLLPAISRPAFLAGIRSRSAATAPGRKPTGREQRPRTRPQRRQRRQQRPPQLQPAYKPAAGRQRHGRPIPEPDL